MSVFTVLFVIIIISCAVCLFFYHRIIAMRNRADEIWKQMDESMKQMPDIVSEFVESLKSGTFEGYDGIGDITAKLVAAHDNYLNADDAEEMLNALEHAWDAVESASHIWDGDVKEPVVQAPDGNTDASALQTRDEDEPALQIRDEDARNDLYAAYDDFKKSKIKILSDLRLYNEAAESYNERIQKMPGFLFAGMYGLEPMELF